MANIQKKWKISTQEKLTAILEGFMKRNNRVQATAIVTADGFIIAYALQTEVDVESLAAMPSAILSLSKKATRDLMKGELEQVYLKGADGYLLMLHSREELFLTALVTNAAKLGMIFLEMKKAVRNILDIL